MTLVIHLSTQLTLRCNEISLVVLNTYPPAWATPSLMSLGFVCNSLSQKLSDIRNVLFVIKALFSYKITSSTKLHHVYRPTISFYSEIHDSSLVHYFRPIPTLWGKYIKIVRTKNNFTFTKHPISSSVKFRNLKNCELYSMYQLASFCKFFFQFWQERLPYEIHTLLTILHSDSREILRIFTNRKKSKIFPMR